ncbi:DUF2157 domain-containing protein [Agriterribacter sp.]|uniref:DUF2157 domain-containing protein n=1 Tax=Agriterribacter sp. TaxID=2821509 RepID=UPI002BD07DEC|nr:DUF2157 domain-containing protein [Agriterribacter sp.]HRO47892.1 DUF2157 domain-containing protein [Agriterribacter sp.]HRQ15921.1 DUF2157 domain-containing protein [Agriterribacter sp.]
MSKSFVKELQELVAANIITPVTAQEIADYYKHREKDRPNRFSAVVNILGALLVSLGIVLVVAHNWDELGRAAKTFFAFLPLVIGQGLCLYVLLKKKSNIAWREPAGVILFFAVASSISLISQTYHISGTMSGFLLTWMLLSIPIVYILPSSIVALLYIAGITWYACNTGYFNYLDNAVPFYYLLLLALVIPHYYSYLTHKKESNFFHLLNWLLVLSVTIVLGSFSAGQDRSEWVFTGYLALFSVFYLLGRLKNFNDQKLFANPFLIVGTLGTIFILMFWSFDWSWTDAYRYSDINRPSLYFSPFLYITIAILIIAGWLILSGYRAAKDIIFDPAGFSGFVLLILLLAFRNMPHIAVLLINLWILFLAVFFIRKGALQDHLGILNFGLLIIATLAVLRFFDDEIPFIWRGFFFLITGTGFFAANYMMVKKRKAITKK